MEEKKDVEYGWNQDMDLSLHDKIRLDLKNSMLQKQNDIRDTLRVIMGEFPKLTVPITLESGKKTFRVKTKSEKSVLELQKKESSPYLKVLGSYLPKMAGSEEVMTWINENIELAEYKSPMQAMGTIMKHFGKLADGNMVKGLLQELSKR
jgi:uncharacterized protein YqeY